MSRDKSTDDIHLTDREEEIMLRLWEYGPCSVKTVIDHMPDPKPHFNTVSTFIRLLEDKGYVGRQPRDGRGFLYYALLPKNRYRRKAMSKLVADFFGDSFSMVSQLVRERDITAGQLRELIDLIDSEEGKSRE